jgi:hypothetical protein
MPLEFLSWVTLFLVVASVGTKIVTAHVINSLKAEFTELNAELRKQRATVESLAEHRKSLEENLEFFERRRGEDTADIESLQSEFGDLESSWNKHLEELGYDPETESEETPDADQAPVVDAATTEDTQPVATEAEPAGEFRSENACLDPEASIAVLPASLRDPDKLFLPDAIVTELLALGSRVIDRSALIRELADTDEDLGSILSREEYHKLAAAQSVDAVAVINSRLHGDGVGSATCRVVQLASGDILLSTSYEQPGRDEQDEKFDSLVHTARRLAQSIHGVIGKTAVSE